MALFNSQQRAKPATDDGGQGPPPHGENIAIFVKKLAAHALRQPATLSQNKKRPGNPAVERLRTCVDYPRLILFFRLSQRREAFGQFQGHLFVGNGFDEGIGCEFGAIIGGEILKFSDME